MTTRAVYERAAEILCRRASEDWYVGCCVAIINVMLTGEARDLFAEYFMPAKRDKHQYWFGHRTAANHQDRLIALLLMAEIADDLS